MKSIKKAPNQNGFTLIELIVVIILISIMAATVLPKFLTSSGFEEYTYRDELIIKLRAIQLRTMQQTNGSTCQQIQFTDATPITQATIGLLATTPNATTCEAGYAGDSTSVVIDDDNINFVISDNITSFSFTSLGKALCVGLPCEITIKVVGESEPELKINAEGYIYVP